MTDTPQTTETPSAVSEMAEHARLVQMAEKWLWRQNCGVVFRENFRAAPDTGEQPDAIGWRHAISILVECKASRSDFLADRRKPFRADPGRGMGDWRFFLSAPGVIGVDDLPSGWGLLHATGSRILQVHGVPGNAEWWSGRPFVGAKGCEIQMMYSALRRMHLRGHLTAIYEPLIGSAS